MFKLLGRQSAAKTYHNAERHGPENDGDSEESIWQGKGRQQEHHRAESALGSVGGAPLLESFRCQKPGKQRRHGRETQILHHHPLGCA